jgi:hypothetical protein
MLPKNTNNADQTLCEWRSHQSLPKLKEDKSRINEDPYIRHKGY